MNINIDQILNDLDRLFEHAINNQEYIFDVNDDSKNKLYQVNIKVSGIKGDVWKLCVITDKEDIYTQYIYASDKGNWVLL